MPLAAVYTGVQAIKQVYQEALSSSAVDSICLSDNYQQVLGNWFETEYEPKLHDGKRVVREILSGPTLPVSQTDVVITDTFAALITFGSNPGVIKIEDSALVRTLKQLFEALV